MSDVKIRWPAARSTADQQIRAVPIRTGGSGIEGMRKSVGSQRLQPRSESPLKLDLHCMVVRRCRVSDKPCVKESRVRVDDVGSLQEAPTGRTEIGDGQSLLIIDRLLKCDVPLEDVRQPKMRIKR